MGGVQRHVVYRWSCRRCGESFVDDQRQMVRTLAEAHACGERLPRHDGEGEALEPWSGERSSR